MKDRSTLIDLALAFAATFVITLALWPQTTPRQVVRCNTTEAGWKTYSIPIDDPSLDELKEKIHRWKTPEISSTYAAAKWQKEVAEFYENCKPCNADSDQEPCCEPTKEHAPTTASISDTVITASYEMPIESDHSADHSAVQTVAYLEAASPSDANYWATVRASAEASIKAAEERSMNVPVVFEKITSAGWPQLAFHFAFLFGIAAACGYMHWLKLAPIKRELAFHHQPLRTLARIGTFSGLICFAMISAIAVWV